MIKINGFKVFPSSPPFNAYYVYFGRTYVCTCRDLRHAIGNVIMMLNSTLW